MYKSPIDIVYGQMETQLEGHIMKAVQNVHVNVDKEELIRALQYDRDQYEKGFRDGTPRWIPVTERLPDMRHDVLVSRTWWNKRKPAQIGWYNEVTGNWYILTENGQVMDNKVTHWMPLPQPPKEG